jgi:hypothetical protein
MSQCATCGNEYDKCFEVVIGETSYFFDCFECADLLVGSLLCKLRLPDHRTRHGVKWRVLLLCALRSCLWH